MEVDGKTIFVCYDGDTMFDLLSLATRTLGLTHKAENPVLRCEQPDCRK